MSRNMDSEIFRIIDDMDAYIGGCKPKLLSSTEIIVDRQKMEDFLRDLRRKAPEEIEKYRKIIKRSEEIIEDSKVKAQALIDEATARTDELLSQNEIMQRAYRRADEVVAMAQEEAQSLVDNAMFQHNSITDQTNEYMEGVMVYLEGLIDAISKSTAQQYEGLMSTLKEYGDRIRADHSQLHPEEPSAAQPAEEPAEYLDDDIEGES